MAISNVTYNATAKSTVLSLLLPVTAVAFGLPPIIVFSASGRTKWFNVAQSGTSITAEIGCDGSFIAHQSPAGTLLTGAITFNPGSPTIPSLANLMQVQLNTGQIFPGKLLVENTSTGTSVEYSNFLISKSFNGFDFSQQVDDYEFPFFTTPPGYLDLASITSVLSALG